MEGARGAPTWGASREREGRGGRKAAVERRAAYMARLEAEWRERARLQKQRRAHGVHGARADEQSDTGKTGTAAVRSAGTDVNKPEQTGARKALGDRGGRKTGTAEELERRHEAYRREAYAQAEEHEAYRREAYAQAEETIRKERAATEAAKRARRRQRRRAHGVSGNCAGKQSVAGYPGIDADETKQTCAQSHGARDERKTKQTGARQARGDHKSKQTGATGTR